MVVIVHGLHGTHQIRDSDCGERQLEGIAKFKKCKKIIIITKKKCLKNLNESQKELVVLLCFSLNLKPMVGPH